MKFRKLFVGCVLVFTIILSNSRIDNKFVLRKEIVSADASGTWKKSNYGRWWFAYSSGGYAVGWEIIGGKWYHFNSSGWMETGWINPDGNWYYLDDSGAMVIGWLHWGSKLYYLKESGVMVTGFYKIDGIMRYFNEKGENVLNINAWFVGANYGYYNEDEKNIDTTSEILYAREKYSLFGYISDYSLEPTYNVITGKNSNGIPRMASPIQIYSGHGSPISMSFDYKGKYDNHYKYMSGIHFKRDFTSELGERFATLKASDMQNVKLIIFAGCSTADNVDNNITHRAYYLGAKTSIGWRMTTKVLSHNMWLKRFNDAVCNNYCIQDALDIANSYLYPDNEVKLYKVYGDKYQFLNISPNRKSLNTKVYNSRGKVKNFVKKDIYQCILEVDEKFNVNEYRETKIENDGLTIYEFNKLVKGSKTLEGYVVTVRNGNILVTKSDEKLNFGINDRNTIKKDSKYKNNIILFVSENLKLNGTIKIVKSENIYENGKFYIKHDLEHIKNDGSKIIISIFEEI